MYKNEDGGAVTQLHAPDSLAAAVHRANARHLNYAVASLAAFCADHAPKRLGGQVSIDLEPLLATLRADPASESLARRASRWVGRNSAALRSRSVAPLSDADVGFMHVVGLAALLADAPAPVVEAFWARVARVRQTAAVFSMPASATRAPAPHAPPSAPHTSAPALAPAPVPLAPASLPMAPSSVLRDSVPREAAHRVPTARAPVAAPLRRQAERADMGMGAEPRCTRTLIIGDVHGCLDELEALLRAAGWTRETRDEWDLIHVGDLLVKGPRSLDVLQFCIDNSVRGVRGNHENAVLEAARTMGGWTDPAGYVAVNDGFRPSKEHLALARALSPAQAAYLATLRLWIRLPAYNAVIVHAALASGVPLEKQQPGHLFNARVAEKDGSLSSRNLYGASVQGAAGADGAVPWAEQWVGPEVAVFGHDATRGLQNRERALGLDSACCYGGLLSALLLPERRVLQVRADRTYCRPHVELRNDGCEPLLCAARLHAPRAQRAQRAPDARAPRTPRAPPITR